ncbi:MAG: sigma-54 dependent transcriptional regulator [Dethiosulfatibacter sp.]|nr:sigma-54 dependent transcriptional regulator [Dethiosulfatibacter sp.]
MLSKNTILLVDDEKSIRDTLKILFEDAGYDVYLADNGSAAITILESHLIDVVVTDLRMPKMDGIELMHQALKVDKNLQVILITAYADIKSAVDAMKAGAFDYVQKSFSTEEILVVVKKAIEKRKLIEENTRLRKQIDETMKQTGIIGKSPKIQGIFTLVDRIANSKATVLITGESGVGKEVFARLIHNKSDRKNEKFVVINCGAIPETLIESELFGFEKGSFTGADKTKTGKFEQADGGTILLDEVGELPLNVQVKFLRVLQERQLDRIGSTESKSVNVRIIAATNKDLTEEIRMGNFREDLFYRLNVIRLHIPPLRERKEDIPLMIDHFMTVYNDEYCKSINMIDMDALDFLISHDWKGNVRELKNVIERAIAISDPSDTTLTTSHLSDYLNSDNVLTASQDTITLKDYEKIIIYNTLKKANFNKSKAADLLGIKRQTLYKKMKEYCID